MKRSTVVLLRRVATFAIPLVLRWFKNRNRDDRTVRDTPRRPVAADRPKAKARKRLGGVTSAEKPPAPPSRKRSGGGSGVRRGSGGDGGPSPVGRLHARRQSDQIITDTGIVVKCLPDDNEGSRHQRLLVEVDRTDVTIKLAHNIDLAPRVPCREGDRLTFKGEYEYNDLGGAVHWTHHDPKKWREGGWVEHDGKRYE